MHRIGCQAALRCWKLRGQPCLSSSLLKSIKGEDVEREVSDLEVDVQPGGIVAWQAILGSKQSCFVSYVQ